MNRDSAPDTYGPSSPSTASDDYHTNERRKDSGDPAIEGSTEAEEQRTEGPQQTTETRESHFFDSIDILTKWMKGFVWDPNLFENRDFAVEELQAGFHGGYALITDTLDMEMQAVIDTANNPYHNIDVKMEDMYETRESVWGHGLQNHLYKWDVPTLKKWLLEAKYEIQWMRNEIRRLECHMENAGNLVQEGLRRRFTYIPSPREWIKEC